MAENDVGMTMTLSLPTVDNVVASPITALVRGRLDSVDARGGVETTLRATSVTQRLSGSVESVTYGEMSEEVRGGTR